MRHPTARRKLALATAALIATLLPTRARAATPLTWDADPTQPGAQGGSGTWADGAGGWFDGTANVTWNNANLDHALFVGTAAGTVTLSGTARAQHLTFDTPGYTLTGGSLMLGYFSGLGGVHVNADATIASDLRTGPGVNGWIKDGPGTLTLTGSPSSAPLELRSGTVAFQHAGNLPATVVFNGDATSRLRYAGTDNPTALGTSLNVQTVGTLDVPGAATLLRYTGDIRGAGLLVKTGAGTLKPEAQNFNFTGTVRVDAGTLLLDRTDTLRNIVLNGANPGAATLALRSSFPTLFQNYVTIAGGNNAILVDNLPDASSTSGDLTLPSLDVAGGSLSLSAGPGRTLGVWSLTNRGTIDLNNTRLTANAISTPSIPGVPAGTFRFGHEPSGTPNVNNRGLWVGSVGTVNTLDATFAGQSEDADLLVGVTGTNGTNGTQLTLDGAWHGGGAAAATSTLVLPAYCGITFGPNLRASNLPTDPAAAPRPVRLWGSGSTRGGTLTFDPAFVADHTDNGATADGLASVDLSNVTWETHHSQSLPVVVRRAPDATGGGTYRAGLVTFDNFSNVSGLNTWAVKTNDQTYDGGVNLRYNGTISLTRNLTLTGRADRHADNQLRAGVARTLSLTGPGTLTLAGDLGFAPASRISATALVVINTDPGAGWYDGNYTRDPVTGAVTAPPAPSHTLKLSVGNLEGRGGAVFNAPVTRLAELSVGGTAVVSLSLPGPQKVLSVAARLTTYSSKYFTYTLDLTDNAMVLGAGPYHTPDTVRPLLTAGTLRSSAADADHALGYARAADVLPAAADGSYTFLNLPVAADDVLVRYTLLGDATLDGRVNFDDLLALAKNYNATSNAHWSAGDFNYDNAINFDDLLLLAKHYNAALPTAPVPGASVNFSADLAAAFAAVPEPSAALFSLAACGLTLSARRRRRWTPR